MSYSTSKLYERCYAHDGVRTICERSCISVRPCTWMKCSRRLDSASFSCRAWRVVRPALSNQYSMPNWTHSWSNFKGFLLTKATWSPSPGTPGVHISHGKLSSLATTPGYVLQTCVTQNIAVMLRIQARSTYFSRPSSCSSCYFSKFKQTRQVAYVNDEAASGLPPTQGPSTYI